MSEEEKVPSVQEIIKDMKENPTRWVFSPKGMYTTELEIMEISDYPKIRRDVSDWHTGEEHG